MVGLDGSPAAADACRWAAWLAAKTDAHLITASAWLPHQSEGSPDDIAERRVAAESQLDNEWSQPARLVGVAPRPLLLDGSPELLLEAAEAEHADLLVVGNRGVGGLAGLHLGSVAHHLTHHTVRPLAIVPAPTAATIRERSSLASTAQREAPQPCSGAPALPPRCRPE